MANMLSDKYIILNEIVFRQILLDLTDHVSIGYLANIKIDPIIELTKYYWAMMYSNHYGEAYVEWEQFLEEKYTKYYNCIRE